MKAKRKLKKILCYEVSFVDNAANGKVFNIYKRFDKEGGEEDMTNEKIKVENVDVEEENEKSREETAKALEKLEAEAKKREEETKPKEDTEHTEKEKQPENQDDDKLVDGLTKRVDNLEKSLDTANDNISRIVSLLETQKDKKLTHKGLSPNEDKAPETGKIVNKEIQRLSEHEDPYDPKYNLGPRGENPIETTKRLAKLAGAYDQFDLNK